MRAKEFLPENKGLPNPGTYEQEYGAVQKHGPRRLVAMTNEDSVNTITLTDLYAGSYPDDDEMIWNHVGQMDFDIPFTIRTMRPDKLTYILRNMYNATSTERSIYKRLPAEQKSLVDSYMNDPALSEQIIVLAGDRIIDGNHRALAAALTNQFIRYIDVDEDIDEVINEIDHANASPPLNWKPEMKQQCKIIGHADGYDIYAMGFGEKRLFAFLENDGKLLAYIVTGKPTNDYPEYLPLERIENLSKISGLATTLALGIRTLGAKFMIAASEPLTMSGLNWVLGLLKSGSKAFIVTDQDGNSLNSEKLKSEWQTAHVQQEAGPTMILIEFNKRSIDKLTENNTQHVSKSLLLPYPVHLGNIGLL